MKDLIRDRLLEMAGEKRNGFLSIFFPPTSDYVYVILPEYDYLRAEVFVADVKRLSDGSQNVRRLDVCKLIAMLFEDFVENVRHGIDAADLLVDLKLRKQRTEPIELKRVSQNHWQAEQYQQERSLKLRVDIPREVLFRAQVLLRDLHEYDPAFNCTVESLITLLTLDLLREVKRGNGNRFAQGIIGNLEELA